MLSAIAARPTTPATRCCARRAALRPFQLARPSRPARPLSLRRATMAAAKTSQIVVDSAPSQAKLEELGVKRWPTWGCEASKFPWSYDSNETCYVLEGHVIVTPNGGEPVEIKAGEMATFPAGMSCVWDVKSAIRKHYKFH